MNKNKGRPTKLTPEIQEKIILAVKNGNYLETACQFAGVGKSTLYDWLKRGAEAKSGIYRDFSDAIKIAMAEAEMKDVAIIDRVAREGNWTASAWRLERKHPDRWGKKDSLKAEIASQHTETTEVKVEHTLVEDPESRELIKQLWRRQQSLEVGENKHE